MVTALDHLKTRPQWVCWKYEPNDGGKPRKVPVNPRTGGNAASNNPATWGTYEEAIAFASSAVDPTDWSAYANGKYADEIAHAKQWPLIGFMLADDDDLSVADLDNVWKDGRLEAWAQEIVILAETYCEMSPSGNGLHFFWLGKVPASFKVDAASVEVYGNGRYLSWTGQKLNHSPDKIAAAPKTLAALRERAESFGKKKKAKSRSDGKGPSDGRVPDGAAMANLDAWVPVLFPQAKQSGKGWRVSSASLGRQNEEDISITPEGIKDFGVHDTGDEREGKRTPTELVMEHLKLSEDAAIDWLCDKLGIEERIIRVIPSELPRIVNEAEDALVESDRGFYQRGFEVVRTGWIKGTTAREKKTQTHVVMPVDKISMIEAMTSAARFVKWNVNRKKFVACDCPDKIAETYLSRIERKLPVLYAISDTPFLRYDGSIVETPGYDEQSGILYEPNGVVFPPIPQQPTQADGREALDKLLHLLREFPFVDGTDQSVALSAILTALDRRVMRLAPLHGITAPVAGSGKTLLAEIAAMIATGQEPAAVTFSPEEVEFRKELTSILSGGQSCISIDNITDPLGGAFLNSVLTSVTVQSRVLGHNNKMMRLNTNVSVFANGNNLTFQGDFTRRALRCRLDPQMEQPETRNFSGRPIEDIEENRAGYVVAALTALRAYHVAKPELSLPAYNSFEDYNYRIIGPLVWLGEANPRLSGEEIREDDPDRQKLEAMMIGWANKHGDDPVTLAQVTQGADADFYTTMRGIAGDRQGVIDIENLGKWMRSKKDRPLGERKFVRAGTRKGHGLWQLKGAGAKTASQKDDSEPEIPF